MMLSRRTLIALIVFVFRFLRFFLLQTLQLHLPTLMWLAGQVAYLLGRF
jgi:hypothetical protein